MNLIEEAWIPVRTQSGAHRWIAPWQITEDIESDAVIAIDAPRADFTGALMQFLIGLLQTAVAPEKNRDWAKKFRQPPEPEALKAVFEEYSEAFYFGPKSPSFMEDFDLEAPLDQSIEALFVDGPGKSTLEKHRDFFVKGGVIKGVCPEAAAWALFTFQTYSPGRGAGYRASLRKVGPLTTILTNSPESGVNTLWHNLWLNILPAKKFDRLTGNHTLTDIHAKFPWMARSRLSDEQGCKTTPEDAHPLIVYWAMPCRIRLDWVNVGSGICDITGRESDSLLQFFSTTKHGASYQGAWIHPLTSYREKSDKAPKPMTVDKGGIFYRHWLGYTTSLAENTRPAAVVGAWDDRKDEVPDSVPNILAFGYDMESAAANCWYESIMPFYYIEADSERFAGRVGSLITGADQVSYALQDALIRAWFGNRPPQNAKSKTSFISDAFWHSTEANFYGHVKQFADAIDREDYSDDGLDLALQAISESWINVLRRESLDLFNHWVTTGYFAAEDPQRASVAHNDLMKKLYGKKLKITLHLEAETQAA